jgi:hypothetical protein
MPQIQSAFVDDATYPEFPRPHAAHVGLLRLANQAIPSAAWTSVAWDVHENAPTNLTHVLGATTITVQVAGNYLCSYSANFATNAVGGREARVSRNGSVLADGDQFAFEQYAASGGHMQLSGTCVVKLNVGDFVELSVFQGSGGALDLGQGNMDSLTRMSMTLLRPGF